MSKRKEMWRPIPGAEAFYSVSDFGRVRSEPQKQKTSGRNYGRILKPRAGRKGYLLFRICLPGEKSKQVRVHRVVALAFIGPCPDGMQVNHKDGDKANNRPKNLEYATCKENIRHGWKIGLHEDENRKGEAHNCAKLNEVIVAAIRRRYPKESLGKLATEFGVTKQCIWFVVKRKTWSHI